MQFELEGGLSMRLRRSELSTPASSERMIAKAAASAADLVFLDLEDSVALSEKVGARWLSRKSNQVAMCGGLICW